MDRKQIIERLNGDLAGEPTTTPRPVPAVNGNKAMLQAVLEAENRAKADYTQRAKDAEETERILRDWPLS